MFIDTHAHLLDERFDKDRQDAVKRALSAGVARIIEIGCTQGSWQKALEFAEKNENIYCALGIHPQDAKTASEKDFSELERLSRNIKCVAIGETGFDYHYEYSPRQIQKEVFLSQLKIARRATKPLIIHCREAYKDLIETIESDFSANGPLKGVIHCFSGTKTDAAKLIQLGFMLGIDGPVTYPSANDLRETVETVPLESILLETDAPYLPPQKYRGQRNEPAYIPLIAKQIAEIKKINVEAVEKNSTDNAVSLFGLNIWP